MQLALITADEVTLSVVNEEGWNVTFDKRPPKVYIVIGLQQLNVAFSKQQIHAFEGVH